MGKVFDMKPREEEPLFEVGELYTMRLDPDRVPVEVRWVELPDGTVVCCRADQIDELVKEHG